MRDNRDPAQHGLSWPEAYGDILPVIQREWGVEDEIYLTRQLGGGKSGALVFFVDISTKTYTGQAILKLDRASDSADQEETEAALHARAIEDAPDFAKVHLPRVLHSAHLEDQVAVLSTIAGRGLEYVVPWVDCSYDRKLKSIRKISADLLETWNASYRISPGLQMPQELLRSWLEYRHDPARGGRIHAFLGEECGIAPETPTLTYDGHWYPNPLAFIEEVANVPKRVCLRGVVGHCHGDFHGLNLLVGRRATKALEYYLIDLAMYQSEQFLFYDQAYFELANLLFTREGASPRDWEAIVAQLCRFQLKDELPELRTDDIGLIELVQAVRGGITNWIKQNQADRLSFMESQMLLSRIAAGMGFAHRRMSLETRQMAFFYAAANLKDYIKLHRLNWPKTGPVFEIGAESSIPQDVHTSGAVVSLPRASANDRGAVAVLSTPSGGARWRNMWGIGAVCLAAVLIAAVAFTGGHYFWPRTDSAIQAESPTAAGAPGSSENAKAAASLAVLPFTNLNADGDDGFVDGLSIEIANVLAQTGAFKIPGMTSTFRFKGNLDDTRAIGQALNTDYLVEGTVRRSGDDLRIAVSLVRAEDDFQIWSQTFNEKVGDVFVTQERIAEAIGAALATPLDIDADILEAQRTANPHAYELFVRGLVLLEQRGDSLKNAMAVLERAVELNPDFAAAWGALSLVYKTIPFYLTEVDGRPVHAAVYYRRSTEAARKAQEIDPDLPVVRHAVASMYQRERQWAAAEDEYQAALRGDPSASRVLLDYAVLLFIVGKRAEALKLTDRARELDPVDTGYRLWNDFLRLEGDQTEANIEPIEDIFRRFPAFRDFALRFVIDYRARTGQLDKARDLIEACSGCSVALRSRAFGMLDAASTKSAEQLFVEYRDDNIIGYQFLYAFGGADIVLEAFQYYALDTTRRYGFRMVPWTLVDVLYQDKRFLEIADDLGLVSYWRTRGNPDNCTLTSDGQFTCTGGESQ